jgi:hypothetical protein
MEIHNFLHIHLKPIPKNSPNEENKRSEMNNPKNFKELISMFNENINNNKENIINSKGKPLEINKKGKINKDNNNLNNNLSEKKQELNEKTINTNCNNKLENNEIESENIINKENENLNNKENIENKQENEDIELKIEINKTQIDVLQINKYNELKKEDENINKENEIISNTKEINLLDNDEDDLFSKYESFTELFEYEKEILDYNIIDLTGKNLYLKNF